MQHVNGAVKRTGDQLPTPAGTFLVQSKTSTNARRAQIERVKVLAGIQTEAQEILENRVTANVFVPILSSEYRNLETPRVA